MSSRTGSPLAAPVLALVALLAVAAAGAGCGVNVSEDHTSGGKAVDIQSPVGDLSVRTNVDAPETGLPVYPGATALREGDEPGSANVSLTSAWIGLNVNAAKYTSSDTAATVLRFYRGALEKFGTVTECHGNVEFEGRRGAKRPACEPRTGSREIQLVAGTEDDFRLVSVKPRGDGTEFSVVHVAMNDKPGAAAR